MVSVAVRRVLSGAGTERVTESRFAGASRVEHSKLGRRNPITFTSLVSPTTLAAIRERIPTIAQAHYRSYIHRPRFTLRDRLDRLDDLQSRARRKHSLCWIQPVETQQCMQCSSHTESYYTCVSHEALRFRAPSRILKLNRQSIPLKDWCRYEQAFSVPNEAIDLAMYNLQFTSDSICHFITALSVQPSGDNNR